MSDDAIPILIKHLHQRAAHRPPGYVEEVMSLARNRDSEYVYLRKDDWAALRQKYKHLDKKLPKPIVVPGLPVQSIPDDFNPEQEKQRMRQGGCCGKPAQD